MDEKSAAKIEGQRQKFDAKRDTGATCYLLNRAAHSADWEAVEVENGFYPAWNGYREQLEIQFATTDENFQDAFAVATHVALGSDIYEILDDQKDKVYPDAASPLYKAFGVRDPKERYAAAAEENEFLYGIDQLVYGEGSLIYG